MMTQIININAIALPLNPISSQYLVKPSRCPIPFHQVRVRPGSHKNGEMPSHFPIVPQGNKRYPGWVNQPI